MLDSLIQSIITKKKKCYFISPHFDDAVLSAGALITYLARYTKIVIINVFTKSNGSVNTFSARTFLKQCGYTDARQLYIDRENEDAAVFDSIAYKIINLGFVEALWRKKYTKDIFSRLFYRIPELQVIYPTYKYHIIKGEIAKQDLKTLEAIKSKLQENINTEQIALFCPFAIGNHVDHVITRRACDELYKEIIYWSDYPYNLHDGKNTEAFTTYSFDKNLSVKHELVKGYQTQYAAMFENGFQRKPEIFLTKKYV